ncbi:MAG: hypothetical protein KDI71_15925 [Xanthomonadales bacterium]|nr:hypothetical protein [Xanthomonadales bacterium]
MDIGAVELTLIIIGALAAMLVFWTGVLWLLAGLSGWRALARRFEAEREPEGERFSMASGGLGQVRFNGVLRVWVGERGLGLGCLMPAAFGAMPTLLLPWRELRAVERRKFLFSHFAQIEVADFSRKISLRGAAGDAVLQAWEGQQSRR